MAASPEPPEPQFPAPGREFADSPEQLERLPPPGKRGLELMAAHLAEEHGIQPFNLERHVHLGGKRPETQHLTWHPGKASFHCDLCPGFVFSTGEITDEMVEIALALDENLKPHLVGLQGDERAEMARLYLSGALNQNRLAMASEAAYRAAAATSRPEVAARRERLQDWMIERYSELGVVTQVIDATEALQHTDPERWKEMVGRPLVASTIRKLYWNPISARRKNDAKQRFERSRRAGEV